MKNDFWNGFPGLQEDLSRVEELLRKSYRAAVPRVREILDDLIGAGGKRLGPALVILGGRLGPRFDRGRTCRLAAAVELLHLATLLHDDWIDGAASRRGRASFHQQTNPKAAVLAGDFLLTRTFSLTSGMERPEVLQRLAGAAGRLCLSELDQDLSGKGWDITEKDYLRRIAGKTAELFAAAPAAGAWENGSSRIQTERLRRFGFKAGMAFQIMDDILDYTGELEQTGKPGGKDWTAQVPTLPLIAARRYGGSAAARLEQILRERPGDPAVLGEVAEILESAGGMELARSRVHAYTDEAWAEIKKLPDQPARELLFRTASRLLYRNA